MGSLERFRGGGRHSRHVQCASSYGVQHGGPVGLRAGRVLNILCNCCDYSLHRHCAGWTCVHVPNAECVERSRYVQCASSYGVQHGGP
eukprot:13241697-Alexandrium_andersonii.AAC.1